MNPQSIRSSYRRRTLLLMAGLLTVTPVFASTYYWDIDDAIAGAGGATPNGTWVASGTTWSTNVNGAAVVPAYTTLGTDDLFFSAGANATGAYAITLNDTQDAKSLTFEEGTATISGAGGIINLGGTGRINVRNFTATPLSAVIGNNTTTKIGGSVGLHKAGLGTLTLNGSEVNTFTGGLNLTSSTLALNFANLATPTNLVDSSNALSLGGGTLSITGKSAGGTSQTLGGITVNSGGGRILANPNGGTSTTVALGNLSTASSIGTFLAGRSSTSGTLAITTTNNTLTNGIYGSQMVFWNGTANTGYDWLTNTGGAGPDYTLSGLGSYTALPDSGGAATDNYQMTASTTLTGGFSVNTLKMAPAAVANVTLDLGGNTLTVDGGGILYTGSGTNNTIQNGTVTAGAGSNYKLNVHNFSSQFVNSGGSNPNNNASIKGVIANNGADPVSLVVHSTPGGTTGKLYLGGANTFTGGIYLNNGALNLAGGAGTLNNNTINISGHSIISIASFSTGSAITLGDDSFLDFRLNTGTFTTTGAVTGGGGIILGQAGGGATNLNFNSTGNTFTGAIEYRVTPNGQNGSLSVNSFADSATPGEGNIRFGVAGGATNSHIFSYGSGAVTGLTLNNRRFELAGTVVSLPTINNNSGQTFTINSDLLVTGGSSKTLTLGGSGAGVATFAGDIANNPTPIAGSTLLAVAYVAGVNTISLGSIDGITLGSTITGTGIAAGTTITAINPTTKQVTLSANTTGAGGINQTMSIPTVLSNVSLLKSGASVWTLSGDNSFTGGITLSGATANSQLNINSATALGTGTFTISGGNNAKINNTSGSAITLSNNNAQIWNNDFAFVGSNSLNVGTGAVTIGGNRGVTVTASTLTVGGIIDDGASTFGITKNGGGTLVLGGANTYNGATNVTAGTLLVNGLSSAADGLVTVSGTGTLGGNGTIGGVVNVTSTTAKIAPGTSTGILSAVGNVTIGGDLDIEIDDTQTPKNDTLAVGGVLDITAGILNLAVTGTPTQPVYVIATYGSLAPLGGPFFGVTGLPAGYTIDYAHNSGTAIAIKQIGGDVTPPAWVATWPQVDTVASTSFTARARINEAGTAYYVVLADGAPAPTSAAVKAGAASIALAANVENTALVTGLTAGTAYDVWFVAEDAALNLQASPVKVDVATPFNFSDWIAGFPGAAGNTSFGGDPDGDGIGNGLENFFGSNPGAFTAGLIAGVKSGNTFTFTHPQNATPADDVSAPAYTWSTSLSSFTANGVASGGTTVTLVAAPNTPTAGTTTVTATITGTPISKLFVRVGVTQVP